MGARGHRAYSGQGKELQGKHEVTFEKTSHKRAREKNVRLGRKGNIREPRRGGRGVTGVLAAEKDRRTKWSYADEKQHKW